MTTTVLKAEVQTRIDALAAPVAAEVILQNAVDTVGLDLNLVNIKGVLNSATTLVTGSTPANDVTALNSASIALGVTVKPSSGGYLIGDVIPLNVEETSLNSGLHINAAGQHWLKTGVVTTDVATYPDAKASFPANAGAFDSAGFTWTSSGTLVFGTTSYDFDANEILFTTWQPNTTGPIYRHNASTGVFTGGFGTTLTSMYGLAYTGAFIYVNGYNGGYKAEQRGITGTLISNSLTTMGTSNSLAWNGTDIASASRTNGSIYGYNATTGAYSRSITSDWRTGTGAATGAASICYDGTYYYVVENTQKTVYQLDSAGAYTGNSFLVTEAGTIKSIEFDGTHFWISLSDGLSTESVANNRYQGYVAYAGVLTAETDVSSGLPMYVRIK
jgi:VCBS repeat-containing protein